VEDLGSDEKGRGPIAEKARPLARSNREKSAPRQNGGEAMASAGGKQRWIGQIVLELPNEEGSPKKEGSILPVMWDFLGEVGIETMAIEKGRRIWSQKSQRGEGGENV